MGGDWDGEREGRSRPLSPFPRRFSFALGVFSCTRTSRATTPCVRRCVCVGQGVRPAPAGRPAVWECRRRAAPHTPREGGRNAAGALAPGQHRPSFALSHRAPTPPPPLLSKSPPSSFVTATTRSPSSGACATTPSTRWTGASGRRRPCECAIVGLVFLRGVGVGAQRGNARTHSLITTIVHSAANKVRAARERALLEARRAATP